MRGESESAGAGRVAAALKVITIGVAVAIVVVDGALVDHSIAVVVGEVGKLGCARVTEPVASQVNS